MVQVCINEKSGGGRWWWGGGLYRWGKPFNLKKKYLMSSNCCSVKERVESKFQGGAISRAPRGENEKHSSLSSLESVLLIAPPELPSLSSPASSCRPVSTGGFLQCVALACTLHSGKLILF